MNVTYYSLAFDTKKEIMELICQMRQIAIWYGCVTCSDMYDLAGRFAVDYRYNQFGWTDIKTFAIVDLKCDRGRFVLILPKPFQLA